MSTRLDRSWTVLDSIENDEHDRCVDLFRRPDGSHGFQEFRRDPEDRGVWTPIGYQSGQVCPTMAAALAAARQAVTWLGRQNPVAGDGIRAKKG